jgi:DNA invertase Pin-like site-specific DNA recombinase
MPDKPTRRAVAYVRESTEEQGRGYSPDGQRQAIARYATDHGLTLGEEYLDFETGRLADKRPGFQRLIEDAMDHRFDCVLVFHTSRFARNTVEAKRYKKLLRSELGIDVISVTQPLGADTTEATQRRGALEERQRRSRDLYEIGDLTRPEYMARREAINTELAQLAPEPIPDLDQAQQVLNDFSIF